MNKPRINKFQRMIASLSHQGHDNNHIMKVVKQAMDENWSIKMINAFCMKEKEVRE